MSQICWGYLSKSADEVTTIEQQIDIQVSAHDSDPNAHLGPGYALWAHRLSAYLDHPYGSVRNVNIIAAARSYDYIVDLNGDGDFDNIPAAISALNAAGGGSIFINSGTYNITGDLEITVPVEIYGEGSELTILDFQNSNYKIYPHGSGGAHLPSFDLHGVALYNHGGINGAPSFVQYVDNPVFDDVKVTYCDNGLINNPKGLYFESCHFPRVTNCLFSHNTIDIEFAVCNYIWVTQNHTDNNSTTFVNTYKCKNIIISDNYSVDCAAFYRPASTNPDDFSEQIAILNNQIVDWTGDAILELYDKDFQVLGNHITDVKGEGNAINVDSTYHSQIVSNHIQTYWGAGVYVQHYMTPTILSNTILTTRGHAIRSIEGNSMPVVSNNLTDPGDLQEQFGRNNIITRVPISHLIGRISSDDIYWNIDENSTVDWTEYDFYDAAYDNCVGVWLSVKVRGPKETYIAIRPVGTTCPDDGAMYEFHGNGFTGDTTFSGNILCCFIPFFLVYGIEYKTNIAGANDLIKVMVVAVVGPNFLEYTDFNFQQPPV